MSSYPGDTTDDKARQKIRNILNVDKVRTFVSLQEPEETKRFAPYKHLVVEESEKLGIPKQDIEFLNFPIPDNGTQADELVQDFTSELVDRVQNKNDVLLIHCYGGHGRTGTISAIMMCKMFPNMSVEECMLRVALAHDSRDDPRGYPAPQTSGQVEQVERVVTAFRKSK